MDVNRLKAAFPRLEIKENERLDQYTYTKTGGPCDALVLPSSRYELEQLVVYLKENEISWTILGNASNLIVRDGGIRGVVILLEKMNQVTISGTHLIADAGAKLIDATYKALDAQLTGMEFACGIPGSIGGAVYMNAGAYGGEIMDVLESADVLLSDGTIQTMTNEELAFSYRYSSLKDMHAIVLSATFKLARGEYQQIKEKMDELTYQRESKQPLEYPSCGSVFKRPEGYYTGPLIIEAGLQGKQIGGAQVSTKHAGFIVNVDHATATDYIELIHHIQEVIKEKFDVELETEVKIIGEE